MLGGLLAGELECRGPDRLEGHHRGLAHPRHLGEQLGIRRDGGGEAPEALEQRLGDRLGVAAGLGEEEDEFEQLVVGERLRAALQESPAQALSVAEVVRFLAHRRPLAPCGQE